MTDLTAPRITAGDRIECFDDGFDDSEGGVVTAVTQEADGRWLVAWTADADGTACSQYLEVILQDVEQKLVKIVTMPICACPCHSDGLLDTGECFCTPECIRGEAKSLDFTSREALVAWLVEGDPNGCHSDEDATLEMGQPHTLESALACYRAVMDLE